ncbi:uncharacterized protein DUF1707 [Saccharothrix carnea]|uniref:Uncharacterized protein DUF1707 n=1 Tax=Saccharothrix carnea TaxID=1280637 RepID=A0A2P8I8I0_SACCR|nr:DUF1707 domain-containing protein [Saccharothrix carnea]PSL54776.1 uncharacterized protein DUF1707 [Saccharothrix carnea]
MHESFTRAADDDRNAVVEELTRAHTEGRLTLTEFDERTRAAHEARTYAELSALTADLPPDAPAPVPQRPNAVVRAMTGAWLAASAVNVLVWGVISLSLGEVLYPWWIWVAGPWGLALLVARKARFGRSS